MNRAEIADGPDAADRLHAPWRDAHLCLIERVKPGNSSVVAVARILCVR
jgi:hypothetical protein